jgi:activator of 2-hydroxyglutaryl-CoA dehydratase
MNAAPLLAADGIKINDGCIVFGELDVLNLLNKEVPPVKIASAVMASAAVRACTAINDITFPRLDKVVLLGGLTQNPAFVQALKARSGIDFIIPEEAEYAAAVGCALFAAGWGYDPSIIRGRWRSKTITYLRVALRVTLSNLPSHRRLSSS